MARLVRLYSRNPKTLQKKVVELMLAILLAALESEADKQKFTDIYEQYHPQMEQTALRILKNQHDAEDAVQTRLCRSSGILKKLMKFPARNCPSGRLYCEERSSHDPAEKSADGAVGELGQLCR